MAYSHSRPSRRVGSSRTTRDSSGGAGAPQRSRRGSRSQQSSRRGPRDDQSRGGSSRRSGGPSRRTARARVPSTQTMLYVGGAVAAVGLLVAAVVFTGGSTSEARGARGGPSRHHGALTPEAARVLAKEGYAALSAGKQCLAQAGMPGTSGEQGNLARAREHLWHAQDCFDRAQTVLGNDPALASAAHDCARHLYTAQKRATVPMH